MSWDNHDLGEKLATQLQPREMVLCCVLAVDIPLCVLLILSVQINLIPASKSLNKKNKIKKNKSANRNKAHDKSDTWKVGSEDK